MRQKGFGRFTYIWQRPDWPAFSWHAERVLSALGQARLRTQRDRALARR